MKKQNLITLDLQLFANEGNEGVQGEGTQEKSYSEAEYLKLKESFDKSASELAKLKKERQSQLSEEEKKKQQFDEAQQQLEMYKNQLEDINIEKELLKGGLNDNEIKQIIENKKDYVKLSTTIAKIFKEKTETIKKQVEQELLQKTKGVQGNNSSDDQESYASKRAKQQNKIEPVQWGSFRTK